MDMILQKAFIQLLNMGVTGGYCIAAVLLLRLAFRKAHRRCLYFLWLIVGFRLLCPVSVSTQFSMFNLESFHESAPVPGTGSMRYIPEDLEPSRDVEVHTGMRAADALVNEAFPAVSVRFLSASFFKGLLARLRYHQPVQALIYYGAYVWAAGVCLFAAYFIFSCRKLKAQVGMAVRVWENVYECGSIPSPFVLGIVKPRIYLPCQLEGKARELVLLHEQCHIRRKDHLVKLLAFFLLAVYWFHPLVWAAWFGVCKDIELCCDEEVLEQIGEGQKKDYSLTLLALGSGGGLQSRIPPAFGENAVKSRIRHALCFRRPKLLAGLLALLVVCAAAVFLGTNARHQEAKTEEEEVEAEKEKSIAELLYESRNPYVGDAPADGRVVKAIAGALPDAPLDQMGGRTELQTSQEPYEFHFLPDQLPKDDDVQKLEKAAALMLALIDNLGEVHCRYGAVDSPKDAVWTVESVQEAYGIEDIKAYAISPEKVQELLDLLASHSEESKTPEGTAPLEKDGVPTDSDEGFEWYMDLPYEMYEEAVPFGTFYGDQDHMTVLAKSEDGIVTVYGFTGKKYGTRGVTIDYRITPDGHENHNYFDWRWEGRHSPTVAMGDYDRDGRDEIALCLAETEGQLIIFETFDTGTVVPYFLPPACARRSWIN